MSEGAATGFLEGQHASDQHKLAQLAIAEGPITLEKEKIALKQAELTLAQQRKFAELITKANQGGAGPAQGPTDQASRLATTLFTLSNSAAEAGMVEEAADLAGKGAKLQENAMTLQTNAMSKRISDAQTMSALVSDVKPGDTEEFRRRLLIWQGVTGNKADPSWLTEPFTKESKERLLATGQTIVEQTQLKLNEAKLKKENVDTELAELNKKLIVARTKATDELAAARKKAGSVTKGQQQTADAQQNVINQINNMMTKLETMERDPTGMKGRGHAILEHVGGLTGGLVGEEGSEVGKFREDADVLQVTLLNALSPSRYRSKDVQDLLKEIVNVKSWGADRKTAMGRLGELRDLVTAEMKKTGIKPTEEQSVLGENQLYEPEMEAEYQAWKQEQERARSDADK